MTTPQRVDEDGHLPSALEALMLAIDALTGPLSQYVENELVHAPSRYLQLRDSVTGEQVNTGGGGGSKSRPPMWIDSWDLMNEIDLAAECWQPAFTGVPPTVGRFNCILDRHWRPQDVHGITQITTAVQAWVMQIDDLLNPKPKWTLPYPCPNCGERTAYRRDSVGERVRGDALQVGPEGCFCGACKAHWPPGRFLFLGRLLGSLPTNVGE